MALKNFYVAVMSTKQSLYPQGVPVGKKRMKQQQTNKHFGYQRALHLSVSVSLSLSLCLYVSMSLFLSQFLCLFTESKSKPTTTTSRVFSTDPHLPSAPATSPQDLPLPAAVRQVLGKTIYFRGLGQDLNLDRIFVREKLKLLLAADSPYALLAKELVVRMPSALLDGGIELNIAPSDAGDCMTRYSPRHTQRT